MRYARFTSMSHTRDPRSNLRTHITATPSLHLVIMNTSSFYLRNQDIMLVTSLTFQLSHHIYVMNGTPIINSPCWLLYTRCTFIIRRNDEVLQFEKRINSDVRLSKRIGLQYRKWACHGWWTDGEKYLSELMWGFTSNNVSTRRTRTQGIADGFVTTDTTHNQICGGATRGRRGRCRHISFQWRDPRNPTVVRSKQRSRGLFFFLLGHERALAA